MINAKLLSKEGRKQMLVETKAKVGVFSIALGAYLPQFPTLVPEFEAQYESFKKTIPDTVELVDGRIQRLGGSTERSIKYNRG